RTKEEKAGSFSDCLHFGQQSVSNTVPSKQSATLVYFIIRSRRVKSEDQEKFNSYEVVLASFYQSCHEYHRVNINDTDKSVLLRWPHLFDGSLIAAIPCTYDHR
ncbi:hypothetical protein Tcan_00779, partial [Toxocara canis]